MNSPTNPTLMELPYIQDIAGDKTETPVAPFAKAKEKNIIACTRRIYRQDKLMQANIYDYQASDGKALCSEKLCTKHGETKYEYGAVVTNNFHKHTFYPDYYYNQDNPDESKRWYNPSVSRDSITFTGMTNIRGCIDMRSPSYIEFYSYSGFGYCRVHVHVG